MPEPGDYLHEDHLLAWLESMDGDVWVMEFRRTPKGQQRTDDEVRASMRRLELLGLAEYTVNHRKGNGEVLLKARITGDGVAVIRSHHGHIGFWYMSRHGRGSGVATNNYYMTNVGGDVNDSQLAVSGGNANQTQAGGRHQQTPSQAEAMLRGLFARSYEVVGQLSESAERTELTDEIEDAEARVITLIRGAAPRTDDRLDTVAAVQRRLGRIAKRIRDATNGSENPDAAELARDLGEQFIR